MYSLLEVFRVMMCCTGLLQVWSSRLFLNESFFFLVQKERRLLENRRLDLDICKARLKKAKLAEAKAAVRSNFNSSSSTLRSETIRAQPDSDSFKWSQSGAHFVLVLVTCSECMCADSPLTCWRAYGWLRCLSHVCQIHEGKVPNASLCTNSAWKYYKQSFGLVFKNSNRCSGRLVSRRVDGCSVNTRRAADVSAMTGLSELKSSSVITGSLQSSSVHHRIDFKVI